MHDSRPISCARHAARLLVAALALPALPLGSRPALAALGWESWSYTTHDAAPRVVTGQHARLVVPEDPALPAGVKIELEAFRLAATSTTPAAVPVVFLHGGPGGSNAEYLEDPGFRAVFDAVRGRADLVMFDQRGCGKSLPSLVPRNTPLPAQQTLASREAFLGYLSQSSAQVRDTLVRSGHDPRQYHTLGSVEDLEALRRALRVPKIDLLAHSYGTQLAQAYLRKYPGAVAHLVLIGARGMDTSRKSPAAADAFLAGIATLAKADTTVGPQFPDLLATLDRVLAKLDQAPLPVELKDPTGQPFTLEVGGYALRFIVAKFYLNDPDNFRYLPKLLDEIDQARRPWSLVYNLGQILRGGVSFAWFTTDAASGATAPRLQRIASEAHTARLGDAMNFPFPEIGAVWHMPDLGDEFRAPVTSDLPTLLVAGTLDGITPVTQSREILAGFSKGRLLVVENGGHTSQLRAPGLGQAISDFYAGRATPERLTLPPVVFVPLVAKPNPARR